MTSVSFSDRVSRSCELLYNNAASDVMKISPFVTNYGYHPHLDLPLTQTVNVPAVDNLADCLHIICKELIAQLCDSQECAKQHYDTHRLPSPQHGNRPIPWNFTC